jgi:hypothetical protein
MTTASATKGPRLRYVGLAVLLLLALLFLLSVIRRDRDPPSGGSRLHWVTTSGSVLDGSALVPGKDVLLREQFGPEGPPTALRIEEIYDSVFDWLLRQHGTARAVTSLGVTEPDNGVVHSEGPWQLPVATNVRGQSSFRFLDDRGARSGTITSSRLAELSFKVSGRAKPGKPGAFAVDGDASLEGTLRFAVDPRVRVVLMAPWGRGEADLRAYLRDYVGAAAVDAGELQGYLPASQPRGWRFDVPGDPLTGDVDRPASFRLGIHVDGPGRALLAVKVVDLDNVGNAVVSELFVVEQEAPSPSPTPSPSPEPAMSVTGIAPDRIARGAAVKAVVTAEGVRSGTVASVSGSGVTVASTLVSSPTELLVEVHVDAATRTGPRDLVLVAQDGTEAICPGCLVVTPAPVVSGLTPASAYPGDVVKGTITGRGFLEGARVSFGGEGITVGPVTVASPTTLEVDVTIGASAPSTRRSVTVTNPDGGRSTCSGCFVVQSVVD